MISFVEMDTISDSLGLTPVRLVDFSPLFFAANYNGIRIWEISGNTVSIMDTKWDTYGIHYIMCGNIQLKNLTPELFREKLIASMASIDEAESNSTKNSIESSQNDLEAMLSKE